MSPKKYTSISLIPGNSQHIGSRVEQQDAFYLSDFFDTRSIKQNGVLAILADGIGGYDMGKTAASVAIATFADKFNLTDPRDMIENRLTQSINEAHQAVRKLAMETGVDTGTTLVAAVIKDGLLYWIGTGDSRIYLWKNGSLIMLTNDFIYSRTLENLLVEELITAEEAGQDPQRNHLSSYIGVSDNFVFGLCQNPIALKPGNRVLLCSDGLFGTISEAEISQTMSLFPQEAADSLLTKTLAKNSPYQDNVTILIIGCEPS